MSGGMSRSRRLIQIVADVMEDALQVGVVAESAGASDVEVELFCSSTDDDLSFDTILVAGWKRPADTVTVTYTPGT